MMSDASYPCSFNLWSAVSSDGDVMGYFNKVIGVIFISENQPGKAVKV
jgi:hypothetical protein